MKIFLICLAGLVLLILGKFLKFKRVSQPSIKMLNREGDMWEDEWHTYIAGLPYHDTKSDVGGFTGWIANEPNNKYDKNAMAIYNFQGHLLGYIPSTELKEYRRWCSGQTQPCMGYIYIEEGEIRGRVKTLRPCNLEFLNNEFSKYAQWVKDNIGPEYLPNVSSMKFNIEE